MFAHTGSDGIVLQSGKVDWGVLASHSSYSIP